jgi:hypothetical protein
MKMEYIYTHTHISLLLYTFSTLTLTSVSSLFTEKLLSVDVVVVGCGPHHVAVLSRDGEMYTWGRGDGGRLGLGHEEDWYYLLYIRLNKIAQCFVI